MGGARFQAVGQTEVAADPPSVCEISNNGLKYDCQRLSCCQSPLCSNFGSQSSGPCFIAHLTCSSASSLIHASASQRPPDRHISCAALPASALPPPTSPCLKLQAAGTERQGWWRERGRSRAAPQRFRSDCAHILSPSLLKQLPAASGLNEYHNIFLKKMTRFKCF